MTRGGNLHVWESAWDGNIVWDRPGTLGGATIDFQLPDLTDPRALQFKANSTLSKATVLESDNLIRRLSLIAPSEVWTFDASPQVLYQNPYPSGVAFNPRGMS